MRTRLIKQQQILIVQAAEQDGLPTDRIIRAIADREREVVALEVILESGEAKPAMANPPSTE